MPATNLVSLERVRQSVPAASLSDDRLLDSLIASVSRAAEKWCRRTFGLATYDESPAILGGDNRILLRRYPVQSVEAVRHSPAVVMQVRNALTTNQTARLSITSSAFELVRVASAVRIVTTLLYAANPTLAAMASAITALGNGWEATVIGQSSGDYGLWPTADLYISPMSGDTIRSTGALNCRADWAPLFLHVGECHTYRWDSRGWIELESCQSQSMSPSFRIQYTAGYANIPEDIQQACCLWVQELYYLSQRDPLLTNTLSATGAAAGYVSTLVQNTGGVGQSSLVPDRVKSLLAPYRMRNL